MITNEKELKTQLQTIWIFNQDIEMEFSTEKCAMLIIKNGKRVTTEGIELPNQESIKTLSRKITSSWEYWKWTLSNIKDEGRNKKRVPQKNKETSQNQPLPQKSYQ